MPGLVAFNRRWAVGSDDLIVPASLLAVIHLTWFITITVFIVKFREQLIANEDHFCVTDLRYHVFIYAVLIALCLIMELAVGCLSMRGSILIEGPRVIIQYFLYARLVLFVGQFVWLVLGVIWLAQQYNKCSTFMSAQLMLGVVVCNSLLLFVMMLSIWCTYDSAGRSWLKMRRYQASIKKSSDQRFRYSGSVQRNWRHRKALRKYEQSWDRRCTLLFCCVKKDNKNSFSEVAKLFTEFFRDLDVVPSDVLAGLVLLRRCQLERLASQVQTLQCTVPYEIMSGVCVDTTSDTRLLDQSSHTTLVHCAHYMKLAFAAYGFPMFLLESRCALARCCCCWTCLPQLNGLDGEVMEDDCGSCTNLGLRLLLNEVGIDRDFQLLYVNYHDGVGETPFFVALDHVFHKVVVCIRGTLSLQDVLTDLKAESELLPLTPLRDDWSGHKGMVHAASYIRRKLLDERLLERSFDVVLSSNAQEPYELIVTGHSLGAGTAAILSILLRADYPTLHCYAYSPPGGLLSHSAAVESRQFTTTVVLGKDIVPRIGLYQMEALRCDLIAQIKDSRESKWSLIMEAVCCRSNCCRSATPSSSSSDMKSKMDANFETEIENITDERALTSQGLSRNSKFLSKHPTDSQINLITHPPLYLPGNIVHILRAKTKKHCKSGVERPFHSAIWANMTDFSEVLISPSMIHDHLPDKVLQAIEWLLEDLSCKKTTVVHQSSHLAQKDPTIAMAVTTSALSLHCHMEKRCEDLQLSKSVLTEAANNISSAIKNCPLATPETVSLSSLNNDAAVVSRLPPAPTTRQNQFLISSSSHAPLSIYSQSQEESSRRPKSESYCFFVYSEEDSVKNCVDSTSSMVAGGGGESGTITPCSEKSIITVTETNQVALVADDTNDDEVTPVAIRRQNGQFSNQEFFEIIPHDTTYAIDEFV